MSQTSRTQSTAKPMELLFEISGVEHSMGIVAAIRCLQIKYADANGQWGDVMYGCNMRVELPSHKNRLSSIHITDITLDNHGEGGEHNSPIIDIWGKIYNRTGIDNGRGMHTSRMHFILADGRILDPEKFTNGKDIKVILRECAQPLDKVALRQHAITCG